MLEGLEVTVLKFSQIDLTDRADPEYYSKENLQVQHALQTHDHARLERVCDLVASAFYPAATDLYESGDIPFARCVDVINHPVITSLQDELFARIPQWFLESSSQIKQVGRGDIILTKVGTPCFSSVVEDYDLVALSRTVLGLVNVRSVDPYYLVAFLRCKYGFNQLMREREQTIQYQLTLERIRRVLVYTPSEVFQKRVAANLKRYAAEAKRASEMAEAAEQILLHALGLDTWQPPTPLTYTRRASDVFAAGRMDAEHYRPKYQAAAEALTAAGALEFVPLGNLLVNLTNGQTPLHHDLSTGEIPFLMAEHVGDFIIDYESDKCVLRSHHERELARTRIENGDVLITIKGRIGNAAIVEDLPFEVNVNQDIARLQLNGHLPKWYIVSFLNSPLGKLSIEQFSTGQINPFLGLGNLQKVRIPRFAPETMNRIALETSRTIQQAKASSARAHALLARAQRGVEIAVEQSEAAALAYLDAPEL